MARNPRRSDPTGSYRQRVEESDAYENIAGMLPGVGTAMTFSDIEEELRKEEPNYAKIGLLAGTEAVGLIPGVGTVAKNVIRKGSDLIRQTDEVIDVASNIPKVPRTNDDIAQAENLLDDPAAMKNWQETKKEELGGTQRQANPEASKQAAQELFEGQATSQETRRRIAESIPAPQEYNAEQVMTMMPTVTEVTGSLGKKAGKYGILGVKGFDLEAGQQVSSRLDIPAYNNYDTWVVSIHDGTKDAGSVVGFGQAIRLKNINFGSKSKEALDIARGQRTTATGEDKPMGKSTIARIFGEYQPEDPYALQKKAADIIASGSDEWIQVGMNPYRGSAFYNKATGKPVFEADEVIQVGPLVLAKNVKEPTLSQLKELGVKTRDGKIRLFNEGGMAMDEQTEAVFKSSRTGYALGGEVGEAPDTTVGVDPVSGNEVPMGATPEEVRDDIPAQLSEGEYVVPADVVRFYGVKFFEDLRSQAKMGYQEMEENGRIGGEPIEGMEVVEPEDDLPFDIAELQTIEASEGAYVRGYDGGGLEVGDPLVDQGIEDLFSMPVMPTNREQRQYVGPNGEMMLLTFIDGKPDATAQAMIDLGYKPEGVTEEEEETPTVEAPTAEPAVSDDDDSSQRDFNREKEAVKEAEDRFKGKSAKELIEYGNSLVDGKAGKAMKGVTALNPLIGGLASVTRRAEIFNVAKGLKQKYLEAQTDEERKVIDEAFQNITKRGKEEGSGVTGGGGLLGGGGVLRDVDGNGKVDFGDTWLGDLLGFDEGGEKGVQGPKQKSSWNGARRIGGTGTESIKSLKDFYGSQSTASSSTTPSSKTSNKKDNDNSNLWDNVVKSGNNDNSSIGKDAGDGMTWVKDPTGNSNAVVRVSSNSTAAKGQKAAMEGWDE